MRKQAPESLQQHIRELVASFPPLTDGQLARLAVLLRSTVGHKAAS